MIKSGRTFRLAISMSMAALFVPPPNDTTKGQQDAAANDCREAVEGGARVKSAAFMAELGVRQMRDPDASAL
jgi:hypothetical protein